MYEIIMPKIEANTEEAKISEWLKKEGDEVKKGETIFMMETVKAVIEVESEASGILRKILVSVDETVPVLTVVALVGKADEKIDLSKYGGKGEKSENKEEGQKTEQPKQEKIAKPGRIPASPAAKRLAKEHGIQLENVPHEGERISEDDVKNYLKANKKNVDFEISEKGKLKKEFVEYLKKDYKGKKEFGKLNSEDKIKKYRENGAEIGNGVYIGKGSYIIADYLKIEEKSRIGDNSIIDSINVEIGKMSSFKNNLTITSSFVKIGDLLWAYNDITIGGAGYKSPNSKIMIGDGCFIGMRTMINTSEPVIIGNRVAIGENVYMYTHSHWLSAIEGYPVLYNPIVLEDYSWIGTACSVLPGVNVGKKAIVTIGSVVMNDIPEGCLATGNPAKVVKDKSSFPSKLSEDAQDKIMKNIIVMLGKQLEFQGHKVKIGEGSSFEINGSLVIYSRHAKKPKENYKKIYLIGFEFNGELPENTVQFDLKELEVRGERDKIYDEVREQLRRYGIKFNKPFLWRYGS